MTVEYLTESQRVQLAFDENTKSQAAFADKIRQLTEVPKNHNGPLTPPPAAATLQASADDEASFGLTPNRAQGHSGTVAPVDHPNKAQQLREIPTA